MRLLSSFETPARALNEGLAALSDRITDIKTKLSLRVSLRSEFAQLVRELGILRDRRAGVFDIARRIEAIKSTISGIVALRDKAKAVAHAATVVLTLLLALQLSALPQLPWLVLDDVHIAQFAALLKTLSKGWVSPAPLFLMTAPLQSKSAEASEDRVMADLRRIADINYSRRPPSGVPT